VIPYPGFDITTAAALYRTDAYTLLREYGFDTSESSRGPTPTGSGVQE